jgi:hypothetical protein
VHPEAVVPPEEAHGWTVLATTVRPEMCTDVAMLQAYQAQHLTVAPGCRWIKNPAAISPVWLEKPERMAALAMLTVVGFKPCQDLLYISGDFRRLYPVGTVGHPP